MKEKLLQAADLYRQIETLTRQAHAEAAQSPPDVKSRKILQQLQGFETEAFTKGKEIEQFVKENTIAEPVKE